MKNQTARNEYLTLVNVEGADGWRNAVKAHTNLERARGYAMEQAEALARRGLRAEVRIYAAGCIDCVSAGATDAKGGAL